MAIFSPAADEIVVFRQGKQREDIRRIVLEVAIQGGDQVSAGLMEAGIEGRRLPVIPVEVEDPDLQVVACEFVQQRPAPVSAPVVHVNDLEGADLAGQGFQDLRGQGRQVVPLVIDRDHDGEARSCGLGHGLPGCSLMRYLIKPAPGRQGKRLSFLAFCAEPSLESRSVMSIIPALTAHDETPPQLIGEFKPVDDWQAHINALFYGLRGGRVRDYYQTMASADYRLAHALAVDFRDHTTKQPNLPPTLVIQEWGCGNGRSEEHTSELQSLAYLVCRLLLEKKKHTTTQQQQQDYYQDQ